MTGERWRPKNTVKRYRSDRFGTVVDNAVAIWNGHNIDLIVNPNLIDESWWYKAADRWPRYRRSLSGLKNAFDAIAPIKIGDPGGVAALQGHFGQFTDLRARELLADVLLARMTPEPGRIEQRVDVRAQAAAMAGQLGLPDDWQGVQAEQLEVEDVMESILEGRLDIRYQPPRFERNT